METADIARKVVEVAAEKQAADIVMLDLRGVCSFADYFVICSGTSPRQIRTITEEVEQSLKTEGVRLHHREGSEDTGWVLMDFGDVVVHVFYPREREYYGLERLWRQATPVVRIQ
ncbi:MAG: ribosome silencing factor [Chloroflexi bacterium]|nr:ribosome silencing factor [Chloroflexota bacterium]